MDNQPVGKGYLEPQIKVIPLLTRAIRHFEMLCHDPSLYITFWALPGVSSPLYPGLWASNKGSSAHPSEAQAPAEFRGALGL